MLPKCELHRCFFFFFFNSCVKHDSGAATSVAEPLAALSPSVSRRAKPELLGAAFVFVFTL